MNGYIAFVKKEFMENTRTFKLLIILIIYFIFGMMSPLLAKLTPEIIKNFAPVGMDISIVEPTALDSYMQFFKNIGQMGLLVLVLIFGSTLTSEYTKGTLINVLTKGLTRKSIIFAKLTVASIIWTMSLVVSCLTTFGYTVYLFPEDKVYNLIQSVGGLWIFGLFLLAFIIFSSTLVKSSSSCLLMVAILLVALFTVDIIPVFKPYNPLFLVSSNVSMLVENYDFTDVLKSLGVTLVVIVGLIWSSIIIFNKKKI